MINTRQSLDNAMNAIERLGVTPTLAPDHEDNPYTPDQKHMDEACAKASKAGMALIYGDSRTLLLDLDDGAAVNVGVLKKLVENYGDFTMASWLSKSGEGEHVVLKFDPGSAEWSHAEAIALEAALGSDPIRAVLSVLRIREGVTNPRVLFKPRSPFDPPRL